MRRLATLTAIVLMTCAGAARAQQFNTTYGTVPKVNGYSTTGTSSSFFSQTMTKPAYTSMFSARPTMAPQTNLSSMLPTFPNMQNLMLMRNIFGGTQASYTMPKQVTPPPK